MLSKDPENKFYRTSNVNRKSIHLMNHKKFNESVTKNRLMPKPPVDEPIDDVLNEKTAKKSTPANNNLIETFQNYLQGFLHNSDDKPKQS